MIAIFPEIVKSSKSGDLESLAQLIRKYFAPDFPYAKDKVLDMNNLYNKIGIQIKRTKLDVLGSLLAKDEHGSFTVIALIKADISNKRQEDFLLAHMLGHFLLDIQPSIVDGKWTTSGYREISCPLTRYSKGIVDNVELKSDLFAAALLLPASMLDNPAFTLNYNKRVLSKRLDDLNQLSSSPFWQADSALKDKHNDDKQDNTSKEILHSEIGQSSLIPRSVAASNYQKTEKNTKMVSESIKTNSIKKGQKTKDTTSKGIKKLRELAKKIDDSVDI